MTTRYDKFFCCQDCKQDKPKDEKVVFNGNRTLCRTCYQKLQDRITGLKSAYKDKNEK